MEAKAICKCRDFDEEKQVPVVTKGYFKAMGIFRMLFHIVMVCATGTLWVGWLIGGYFLEKDKPFCLVCDRKIKPENLRV